jgi:carbonic anhydrase
MKAHTKDTQASTSPKKALEFLREGNQRFVNNLKREPRPAAGR